MIITKEKLVDILDNYIQYEELKNLIRTQYPEVLEYDLVCPDYITLCGELT